MFAEPTLDPSNAQERICAELNTRGIAIMPIRELIPKHMYEPVKKQAIEFSVGPKVRAGIDHYKVNYRDPSWVESWRKDYLVTKFEEDSVIPFNNPLLQLALSSQVLDTVNLYLGLSSRLNQINYWYTISLHNSDRIRIASQNWHRDPEDSKLVKVFIYYRAVKERDGPLEYILESRPGQRYEMTWPVTPDCYPPPEEVEQQVPAKDRVVATGPEGTIIFCDTNGLHRGGFALENARLLSVFVYISPASPYNGRRQFAFDPTTIPAGQRQAAVEALSVT
jgi:hypothetical protein